MITKDWEEVLDQVDLLFIEMRKRDSDLEHEITLGDTSSLPALVSEIGNKSNIPFNKEGVLTIMALFKSYFIGEISRYEFLSNMKSPDPVLLKGVKTST